MVAAALPLTNDQSRQRFAGARATTRLPASCSSEAAALAAALVSGDSRALEQLYRQHRGAAFATAHALLQDAGGAEDVVQEAFLRVWRNPLSYQPARGSLRSWLLTIVRNMAIDQLRSRGVAMRNQPRLFQEASEGEDADDIVTAVVNGAEASRLRSAMGALPAEQRHVLELAFFAGLSHGEIAARTGAPLGTVKGRVRLGLRRLRQDLADLAPTATPRTRAA